MSFFSLARAETLAYATLRTFKALEGTTTPRLGKTARASERHPIHAPIAEVVYADLLAIVTGHPEGIHHLGEAEIRRLAGELLLAVNGAGVTRCGQ